MMPKVAIVILNWNGQHFLERFLPMLIERTPEHRVSLYVADNGSTDGSVSWLREHFPDIPLILFDRNLGYTGGYNKALEQIEAQYFTSSTHENKALIDMQVAITSIDLFLIFIVIAF